MGFGFEHGDGWYALIDELCSTIQWYIDQSIHSNEIDLEYNKMHEALLAGDDTLFLKSHSTYLEKYREQRREELLKAPIRTVREIVPQVIADQVKEKFGTLRFYYHGGDDFIDGAVHLAEAMSGRMCDQCGTTSGVGQTKGWIQTVCKECYSKQRNCKEENWEPLKDEATDRG